MRGSVDGLTPSSARARWSRFWSSLASCAALAGAIACTERERGAPTPRSDGGDRSRDGGALADAGSTGTGGPSCLEGTLCADRFDCGSGSRCNTSVDPPQCALLYCGTDGESCDSDDLCAPLHHCRSSRCRPCAMCGAECVDLSTDPRHCGSCFRALVRDETCLGGEPTCAREQTHCGGECRMLTTTEDCGECGRDCRAFVSDGYPTGCSAGTCQVEAESTTRASCTEICRPGSCTTSRRPAGVLFPPHLAGVATYADGDSIHLESCDRVPDETSFGAAFRSVICVCDFPP